jgi:hypothetical protein
MKSTVFWDAARVVLLEWGDVSVVYTASVIRAMNKKYRSTPMRLHCATPQKTVHFYLEILKVT